MFAVLPQVSRAVRPACRVLPCRGDHDDDDFDDGDGDGDAQPLLMAMNMMKIAMHLCMNYDNHDTIGMAIMVMTGRIFYQQCLVAIEPAPGRGPG